MGDKNLNELLKWGIENSTPSNIENTTKDEASAPRTNLTPEILSAILGGPSDADLMKAAIETVNSPDPAVTLETRLTAFDNLEQLVESLDNANLLATLGLWTPLIDLLGHAEPELRRMAAWCIGTAVQNNAPCQERLLALGGVERLAAMGLGERVSAKVGSSSLDSSLTKEEETVAGETSRDVWKKSIYALSSACRNYQAALDVLVSELGKREQGRKLVEGGRLDATDMDAVDKVIMGLKAQVSSS